MERVSLANMIFASKLLVSKEVTDMICFSKTNNTFQWIMIVQMTYICTICVLYVSI